MNDKIIDQIKKTQVKKLYNGWDNKCENTHKSYHEFDIPDMGVYIQGQRRTSLRVEKLKNYISFEQKNVLDLGCNVGSMLIHLNDIKQGIGFDIDHTCIETAIEISKILKKGNLSFYTLDLDKDYESVPLLFKPDIIFVFSLGMWIKNWKEMYTHILNKYPTSTFVFEFNRHEKNEEFSFLSNLGYNLKYIGTSDDDRNKVIRTQYIIN